MARQDSSLPKTEERSKRSITSSAKAGVALEFGDVPSPRSQTAKFYIEQLDFEESVKLIQSRANQQTIEEEMSSINLDEWLNWDEEKSTKVSASADSQAQKRAFYRLGLIRQEAGLHEEALQNFKKVVEIDSNFCFR